jgi:hypothetical protein
MTCVVCDDVMTVQKKQVTCQVTNSILEVLSSGADKC